MIKIFDKENADYDLTSPADVLTHTPDNSNHVLCQGLILIGDGTKDLDGNGGNFSLTITIGGQTLQANPETIAFDSAVRSCILTPVFPVPAGSEVVLNLTSPNVADSDVDVTAYLYQR